MGFPSIGYLEACRETKKNWVRGWDIMGEGGAREQIMAPGRRQGANNLCQGTFGIHKDTQFKKKKKLQKCNKRIIRFCCRWMNSIMIKLKRSCTESAAGGTI